MYDKNGESNYKIESAKHFKEKYDNLEAKDKKQIHYLLSKLNPENILSKTKEDAYLNNTLLNLRYLIITLHKRKVRIDLICMVDTILVAGIEFFPIITSKAKIHDNIFMSCLYFSYRFLIAPFTVIAYYFPSVSIF